MPITKDRPSNAAVIRLSLIRAGILFIASSSLLQIKSCCGTVKMQKGLLLVYQAAIPLALYNFETGIFYLYFVLGAIADYAACFFFFIT